MKTSIKFLFVFAVFVLAAGFFVASDASAQGTYICEWSLTLNRCTNTPISACDEGWAQDCTQFKTQSECGNNPHTCQLPPNTFACTWETNLPTPSCLTVQENCLSGYTYECSGTQLECKSGQVQSCVSTSGGGGPAGAGECNAGAGDRCNLFCVEPLTSEPPCVSGYKCVAFSDSNGVCQPEAGCTTNADCPSNNDIEYVCETGECKPSTLVGGKTLGNNQTTCRWVEGFASGCIAVDTCKAGSVGLWDTKFCGGSQQCTGLSKEDCEAVPITQCEAVENWGTQTCFNDCASGNASANLCCNAKCGTSNQACTSDADCLGGADGWECGSNNICKFTGKGGFDCRSGGLIPCGGLDCPCTFCDIFIIINRVVDLLLFTIAPILVSIMVIVGGFFVLTSRGAGQLRRGKEFIKWAILGYLLMLIAWVLVNTILSVLDLAEWVGAGEWWDPTC